MSGESYQTEVKKIKLEENKDKLTSFGANYENSDVVCFTSICKELSTKLLDDRRILAFNAFNNKSKFILTLF